MDHTCTISGELVRLLVDIGHVATGMGDKLSAERIFTGAIAARPDSELPIIGYAFSKLSFGEFSAASDLLLSRAYKLNPSSKMVKAMYGFLLYITRCHGACCRVMHELIDDNLSDSVDELDQFAKLLATSVLHEENICR